MQVRRVRLFVRYCLNIIIALLPPAVKECVNCVKDLAEPVDKTSISFYNIEDKTSVPMTHGKDIKL